RVCRIVVEAGYRESGRVFRRTARGSRGKALGELPRPLTRSSASPLAFETLQIDASVGHRTEALGLPDHFAQAFDQCVQGIMLIAACDTQPFEFRANADRRIDCKLFVDSQMQRKVEERIERAALGPVSAIGGC